MTTRLDDSELLRRLVAFDSTSRRSNLPIADFICDYLDRRGVRIDRNASADGNKVNLVITCGPQDDHRLGLGLSGHMDVVPAGEEEWLSDPFQLTRAGDTYVGRGTADMKGFLALAINRFAALDLLRLRRPLVLLLTYDEELGTLGAKHFVETWQEPRRLPRAMIIGEPSSLAVVRMHKGYLKLRIEFTGVPAHSGYPHLGRNAIEPAGRAIVALSKLRANLEEQRPRHAEHFPDVPYATLNVARVVGGDAINVVPDYCCLDLGIRLLPEMSSAAMIGRLHRVLAETLVDAQFSLVILGESPPMMSERTTLIHQFLCREIGQEQSCSVSFATDAGWFQHLQMECVIFGPGSIAVAHKPNENIPIGEFERAGELLERVIHRWCVDGVTD